MDCPPVRLLDGVGNQRTNGQTPGIEFGTF